LIRSHAFAPFDQEKLFFTRNPTPVGSQTVLAHLDNDDKLMDAKVNLDGRYTLSGSIKLHEGFS
jgi:hypothetical protein